MLWSKDAVNPGKSPRWTPRYQCFPPGGPVETEEQAQERDLPGDLPGNFTIKSGDLWGIHEQTWWFIGDFIINSDRTSIIFFFDDFPHEHPICCNLFGDFPTRVTRHIWRYLRMVPFNYLPKEGVLRSPKEDGWWRPITHNNPYPLVN